MSDISNMTSSDNLLKKNDGLLVVEASLSLCFFMFFMLFIWSFSGIFAAQNAASHAALQTVQSIAVDNMSKTALLENHEDTAEVLQLADSVMKLFNGGESVIDETYCFFSDLSDKEGEVKKQFLYFLGGEKGEEYAEALGIDTENIAVTVDENALNGGMVKITIEYSVQFKFGFFGIKNINLTKHAECRLFGFKN